LGVSRRVWPQEEAEPGNGMLGITSADFIEVVVQVR
jgi:hypothetical protein